MHAREVFKPGTFDMPWMRHLLRNRSAKGLPCGLRFVKSLVLGAYVQFNDASVDRLLDECIGLDSLSFYLTEREQVWPAMQRIAKLPLVNVCLNLDIDDPSEWSLSSTVGPDEMASWTGLPELEVL